MATEGGEAEEEERGSWRRAGVADLGILRKKGAACGGSVRGLNEAQLHSAAAIPSPSARVSCVRRRPNYPRTFSPQPEKGERKRGEGKRQTKWTGSRGESDSGVVPFVQSQTLPSSAAMAAVHEKRERGKEGGGITARAREQLTMLENSQVESNGASPMAREWSSIVSEKVQLSNLSKAMSVII